MTKTPFYESDEGSLYLTDTHLVFTHEIEESFEISFEQLQKVLMSYHKLMLLNQKEKG